MLLEKSIDTRRFKNTHLLTLDAQRFLKTGKYTDYTEGTPAWKDYWTEQKKRCIEGYSTKDISITGPHYFYLNFCPIKKVQFDSKGRATKTVAGFSFPDFYDGDYEFFWLQEIAKNGIDLKSFKKLKLISEPNDLNGSKHLIVTKARRKGYSYKNASLGVHQYSFYPKSLTLFLAHDKKYLTGDGIMTKAISYCDFLLEYTPFGKHRLQNTKEHIESGYIEDGISKGFRSQIMAISMSDDPDKARGKDASLIIFEEAGAFSNLEDTLNATRPSVEAGSYVTGQIIVFGTGGDMEGATMDFEKMFNDPETYKFLGFFNIWDPQEYNKICGWFHPAYLNTEGYMDKEGNSDIQGAMEHYLKIRENIKTKARDKKAFTQQIIEFPFSPKEVFSVRESSILPIGEIMQQLSWVENNPNIDNRGIRGYLTTEEDGKIKFNKDDGLREIPFPLKKDTDIEGCLTIYEPPVENPGYSMYIAGLDPYAQDKAKNSDSLGSIFIYKRATLDDTKGDRLVAEMTCRPSSIKEFNENVRKLLIYYNATCLYENMQNNIKEYFENKNCLYLLADTPTCLKATVNTLVRRGKGIHMTKDIKNELELYLRDWLLETNSEGVPNIKFIYSVSLLNELLRYNDTGNFDRCIALMMCILYKIQLTKIAVDTKKEKQIDPFFTRELFVNSKIGGMSKSIFHNG